VVEPDPGLVNRLARCEARVERLGFSEALSRQALATPEPAAFLREALQATLSATGADRAFLISSEGTRLAAERADGQPMAADASVSPGLIRHVLDKGHGVQLSDPPYLEGGGPLSVLAVPLPAGAGVLYLDSADAAHPLGSREQELLDVAAQILGSVLAR
jgi:hypothetical protein